MRATSWIWFNAARPQRISSRCPAVGAGVVEIRLHGDNEFRVFYVARFEEAVYVLHAFIKKTQATRKADIDLGKARYTAMLGARRGRI
jgi:phage-related protein